MPNIAGQNFYALYFNNEGVVNKKRKRGSLPKPTVAEVMTFLEESMGRFKEKYGLKVRTIVMSQEMKDMVDSRVRGKGFLKGVNLAVSKNEDLGLRTIHLSELRETL